MDQAPRDSHVGNNYKLMLKICQRYAKDMQGVILRLQIQDNYLKQKYAIWQRQLPKALALYLMAVKNCNKNINKQQKKACNVLICKK